jgi:hypothetical protein
MHTEPVKSTTIDKVVAIAVGLPSVCCIGFMAVINHYYPYRPLNDILVNTPQYINGLNDILGFFVMLGLPFLLLLVLLNAGLGLAKKLTLNKVLLNLIPLVSVAIALLYCGALFLESFD